MALSIYLIDDLGEIGEYAGFLNAHATSLPKFQVRIFTHYAALQQAIAQSTPDFILADMRFDTIPTSQLHGDIDALALSEAFGGNRQRAEAQIRGMQGLLICRALREDGYTKPIILFASLPQHVAEHVTRTLAPLQIIQGLILSDVKRALQEQKC